MSKAEELAQWLGRGNIVHRDAAAHLRALDASHQRLVEALENCVAGYEADDIDDTGFGPAHEIHAARAALEHAKDLE